MSTPLDTRQRWFPVDDENTLYLSESDIREFEENEAERDISENFYFKPEPIYRSVSDMSNMSNLSDQEIPGESPVLRKQSGYYNSETSRSSYDEELAGLALIEQLIERENPIAMLTLRREQYAMF